MLTSFPSAFVCAVTKWPPKIPSAIGETLSNPLARTTPCEPVSVTVPFPLPPAWIWALTTYHSVPVVLFNSIAASLAAWGVSATIPSWIATPYDFNIVFSLVFV